VRKTGERQDDALVSIAVKEDFEGHEALRTTGVYHIVDGSPPQTGPGDPAGNCFPWPSAFEGADRGIHEGRACATLRLCKPR